MIELLDVSKSDNIYSSLISLKISEEKLKLRFSIEPIDFGHLKRILEFRPYENTGIAKYQYFFVLSYNKENDGLATINVRVEQLARHKQFDFKVTQKYISNIMWFSFLRDKKEVESFIEK